VQAATSESSTPRRPRTLDFLDAPRKLSEASTRPRSSGSAKLQGEGGSRWSDRQRPARS
jgi:hypothetical protein